MKDKIFKNGIGKLLSLIIAVIGLWLVISPWLLGYGDVQTAMVSSEILGAVFIILGGLAWLVHSDAITSLLDWLIAFVSFWVIFAPFILSYNGRAAAEVNTIIIGLVVFVLAVWAGIAAGIAANRDTSDRQNQKVLGRGAVPVTGSETRDEDQNLQQTIMDRLNKDDRVEASDIKVRVWKGQVTLDGSVITAAEKGAAQQDTQAVSGVKSVVNKIEVVG